MNRLLIHALELMAENILSGATTRTVELQTLDAQGYDREGWIELIHAYNRLPDLERKFSFVTKGDQEGSSTAARVVIARRHHGGGSARPMSELDPERRVTETRL